MNKKSGFPASPHRIKQTIEVVFCMLTVLLVSACGPDSPRLVDSAAEPYLAQFDSDYNILVISFDALRADSLGVYGYERRTSPNIDRWAADALVFENFYVAGRSTPSSFAAAFSGMHPFRVFRNWKFESTQAVAGVMQNEDIATFGVFNNIQLAQDRGFNKGFDYYKVTSDPSDAVVLGDAKAALERLGNRRFFGWVHFISPHSPYEAQTGSEHLYRQAVDDIPDSLSGPKPEPETQADHELVRDLYDGEVFYLDSLFQQLLDMLEERGLLDKTMIVVTADHGEQFGNQGRYWHSSVHEPVIRVPLIIRIPGAERPEAATEQLHLNTDLLPTLSGLIGADHLPTRDGISMLEQQPAQRLLVSSSMTNRENFMMMARSGHMKLIVSCPPPEFSETLYNVVNDPLEREDLILDFPAKAGELFDAMSTVAGGDPCDVLQAASKGAEITRDLDEDAIEKLRSLGYIQ